ncbi:MAG: 10 kDa chaperonin [Candidatus Peregrinibacteria bacterium GW2011_GWA2_47_7]|nr:MAG: 10 kDa chaperonin [Candidatus Peregrinibacteria bacterium GW2011_GWA2_47_7]
MAHSKGQTTQGEDRAHAGLLGKLTPVGGRILIEPVEEQATTVSGIVLPDTMSKDKPQKGRVVAVGPGKMTDDGKLMPISIKAGDVVLYTKYGPTEVKIEGKEIFFIEESDVLAIVNQ